MKKMLLAGSLFVLFSFSLLAVEGTQEPPQQTVTQTLLKTQSPIKLKTDFIKQEFIDVLGEDKSYALQRLTDYNAAEADGWSGTHMISCLAENDYSFSNMKIYYDSNNIVNKVVCMGEGIFNITEKEFNKGVDLNEKFGSDAVSLNNGLYSWKLSDSPCVECIYKRSNGFLPYNEFTLNYTE